MGGSYNGDIIYNKYLNLNELENEKIINNLQKLNNIEGTISSKDKLIKQIRDDSEKQSKILYNILYISSGLIISGLIINFLSKYKYYLIFLWIILGIYLMYDYNVFYFKDLFEKKKMEDIEEKVVNQVYDNLDKYFGKTRETDYDKWVDGNCDCNNNNNNNNTEEEYVLSETTVPLTSGYYYYDGSAPKQLLDPLPTDELEDKIYYPDYDKRVESRFNNYDSNHNNKPVLVGTQTYTNNL
jgi:hypothetical protein